MREDMSNDALADGHLSARKAKGLVEKRHDLRRIDCLVTDHHGPRRPHLGQTPQTAPQARCRSALKQDPIASAEHHPVGRAHLKRAFRPWRGQCIHAPLRVGLAPIDHRAGVASRTRPQTDGCAQVHQALRIGFDATRTRRWQLALGNRPQTIEHQSFAWKALHAEEPAQHTPYIAIEDGSHDTG